jgi:HEAT repeat protein
MPEMTKQTSGKKKLPVKYPSVPDSEAGPTRYNEPDIPTGVDRVPSDRFQLSDTRADLRLRIERLLQRKEAASEDAWADLGPDVRALLVEMLDDEAVRSREAVLHRLISVVGQLSVKRGIAPLSAILADGSARNVTRAYAANALGRIGESAAIEALVAAANVKDDMIRRQVAIALGRIDRDAVVPHLLELREDKSIAVAEVAAEAVGRWEEKLGRRLRAKRKVVPTKSAGKTRSAKKKLPAEER